MKPNYDFWGSAGSMGPMLKAEVEKQLFCDAQHYCKGLRALKFDWSESCIEGNDGVYLDGRFDRYSGIRLFNTDDEFIGEGWMEFIFTEDMEKPLFYWEFLSIMRNGIIRKVKKTCGIPKHVHERLKA